MKNQYLVSFILDDGSWGDLFYISDSHGKELIDEIMAAIRNQTNSYDCVIVAISKV